MPEAPFLAKTKHGISAETPHTNCQHCGGAHGDDLGLFFSNWNFAIIELNMNLSVFQSLLEAKVRPSKTWP